MSQRCRCPFCPATFEATQIEARTVQAEDKLHDHISRRHQDMIPEPRDVSDAADEAEVGL